MFMIRNGKHAITGNRWADVTLLVAVGLVGILAILFVVYDVVVPFPDTSPNTKGVGPISGSNLTPSRHASQSPSKARHTPHPSSTPNVPNQGGSVQSGGQQGSFPSRPSSHPRSSSSHSNPPAPVPPRHHTRPPVVTVTVPRLPVPSLPRLPIPLPTVILTLPAPLPTLTVLPLPTLISIPPIPIL